MQTSADHRPLSIINLETNNYMSKSQCIIWQCNSLPYLVTSLLDPKPPPIAEIAAEFLSAENPQRIIRTFE